MKEQLTNMNGAVVTERGTSAGGNKMYFFHINKKEAVVDSVDVVKEQVIEYGEVQHSEFKGVEIPNFGNSDHTEYTYEYEDAGFHAEYNHNEQERVVKAMHNKRCRKPKNDLERFAKYRLGLNLDSIDRIKDGVTNLFN